MFHLFTNSLSVQAHIFCTLLCDPRSESLKTYTSQIPLTDALWLVSVTTKQWWKRRRVERREKESWVSTVFQLHLYPPSSMDSSNFPFPWHLGSSPRHTWGTRPALQHSPKGPSLLNGSSESPVMAPWWPCS